MKKIITQSIKATFLALTFGAVTVFAAGGFVGPTTTPAAGNAPLPINVSMNDQFKQGGIGMSSLLIGQGNTLPGATNVSILGKLGIGSGLSFASIPANGITAVGMISSAQGFWSLKNIAVGFAALSTPPTSTTVAPGNSGSVIADRFCFSGTNGACTTGTWGGGGMTLTGLTNQTIRFSGPNTPVAAANFTNDGSNLALNGGYLSVALANSATDALIVNAGPLAPKTTIVTNKSDIQFWNSSGSRNASLLAYDLTATHLANATNQYVCADINGKLNLCGAGPVIIGSPVIDLQINGQDNYSTTIPDSFTINDSPLLTWSTTSLGAGWTCTASNAWTGQKSSSGGSQAIAVNAYGTQTFVITCVNGAQTVSDTATYSASGYYTYWANASYNAPAQVSYTAFTQNNYPSLAGLTITATAVGSSGGGYTAYLNPGYTASCSTPINSASNDISGSQSGANGATPTRVIVAPMSSIPISGTQGSGAQYISGSLITPASSSGVPTNIPRNGINPGVIYTDSNGIVRGRGGEGTVTDVNGVTVNCTGNNLNGIPGGTGRGTLGSPSTTYWMSVGTASSSNGGADGAIRISW